MGRNKKKTKRSSSKRATANENVPEENESATPPPPSSARVDEDEEDAVVVVSPVADEETKEEKAKDVVDPSDRKNDVPSFATDADALSALLSLAEERPEDVLLSSSSSHDDHRPTLRALCAHLYARAAAWTAPKDDDDDDDEQLFDDGHVETLWAQVDELNKRILTNERRRRKGKKEKRGKKSGGARNDEEDDETDVVPRLLDMGEDDSEEEKKDASERSEDEEEVSDENDEEEDDDARRMRERMERSMAEMEEEDNDDVDVDVDESQEESSLVDPAAEDLNDGFFDLEEMERFADEEEDYHMPADEGDNNDEDEDDNDEGFSRKRYRDDEDLDALNALYADDGEGDDDDDAIHMTAADFFGKPNERWYGKHKGQRGGRPDKVGADATKKDETMVTKKDAKKEKGVAWKSDVAEPKSGNDDEDSWNDHDFGKEDDDDDDAAERPRSNDDDAERPNRSSNAPRDRLEQRTLELEAEALAEKPWQMVGESRARDRPVNSLLECTPEFTTTRRAAPLVTEESNQTLEDLVKSRILAEDWDDVRPRELPTVFDPKAPPPEVSQEKSKLGLGELYEREWLKKATGYDRTADEKKSKEDEAKDEMRAVFASLCERLDALSDYRFAPRPVRRDEDEDKDEASARKLVPAVAMEEATPLHVSDARGAAPEEVYDGGKKRGRESVLKGESETTQQDRKRARGTKKAARRKARQEKKADERLVSRLAPGLNNPYEKRKMREELATARSTGRVVMGEHDKGGEVKTSAAFFKKMRDTVRRDIAGDSDESKRGRRGDDNGSARKKSDAYKL